MRKSLSIGLATVAVACAAHTAGASELNITAKYTGYESGVGQFQNTTPDAGACTKYPGSCPAGYKSILLPWANNILGDGDVFHKKVTVSPDPRDGLFFGFDGSVRRVQVVNDQTGDRRYILFNINSISWGGNGVNNTTGNSRDGYSGVVLGRPKGVNCEGHPPYNSYYVSHMVWRAATKSQTTCYVPFTNADSDHAIITDVSFNYSITTTNPWLLQSGIYRGHYDFQVGSGGDLDLGNGVTGGIGNFSINFVLTVSPNLYLRFNGGENGVVNADLQPPGGWLNWQGKMPPYLSSDVPFDFGASGPVKIHLANCDHPVGDTCGIVDLNGSGSPLGVDALLTDNRLNEDSGKQAIRSRLSTQERVFKPNTAAGGTGIYPAHLLLKTQDGVTQQMQRGHHYGGHMTVVFDSNVN